VLCSEADKYSRCVASISGLASCRFLQKQNIEYIILKNKQYPHHGVHYDRLHLLPAKDFQKFALLQKVWKNNTPVSPQATGGYYLNDYSKRLISTRFFNAADISKKRRSLYYRNNPMLCQSKITDNGYGPYGGKPSPSPLKRDETICLEILARYEYKTGRLKAERAGSRFWSWPRNCDWDLSEPGWNVGCS